MSMDESAIARNELRWAVVVFAAMASVFRRHPVCDAGAPSGAAGPRRDDRSDDASPLGRVRRSNLGTTRRRRRAVTARIVAAQFAFVPQCVAVPQGKPVTFRFASPDVIHGILVTGTNVNTMVVPGYVSEVHTVFAEAGDHLMPCHEFCGLGHGEMLAHIRVLPPIAVQSRCEREGRLWSPLGASFSPIFGRPSPSSPRRRCWASGRCGYAARSQRRSPRPRTTTSP